MSGQRDPIANAYVHIQHEHYNGHAGRAFFCTQVATVANGAVLRTIFNVPSGTAAHANFECDAEALCQITVWQIASYSNASSISRFNSNRLSSNVASVEAFAGGSLEVTSLRLLDHLVGAGGAGQGTGGIASNPRELILGRGIYAFDLTNLGGGTQFLSAGVWWYEPGKG